MRFRRQSISFQLTSQALCFFLLLQGSGIAQALPMPPKSSFVSNAELETARLLRTAPEADKPAESGLLKRFIDDAWNVAERAGGRFKGLLGDAWTAARRAAADEPPLRVARAGGVLPLPPRLLAALLAAPVQGQGGPPRPKGLAGGEIEDTPPAEAAMLLEKAGTNEIPLVAGWNLISIPLELTDPDPAAVFAPIAGQLAQVEHNDVCDTADPEKLYDPADPSASDLTAVTPGMGLWVQVTAATLLPLEGTLPAATTIELCPGWNHLGMPTAEPRHPHVALSSIAGKWQRIFGHDAFDGEDPWEVFSIDVPDWANDLREMRPGYGYWLLASEAATLTISNQGPPPTVALAAPADLAVVTEPTEIRGTVASDRLESWTLTSRPIRDGDAVVLATGNASVAGGTLATFDPTLLLNGLYELELTATDVQGQQMSESIAVSVEGQMKIGHFTLSFVDLQVPVSGLAIEIVRTYQSRDEQQRDFGVGWSLEVRQGSYVNNRPPGDGWQLQTGLLPCDTVVESKSHLTVVRLSDQEVYRFALRLQDGAATGGGCFATASFDFIDGPRPGATLEMLGNAEVFYANGGDEVVDADTFELYEPNDVKLTTLDRRVFELDLSDGVTRVEDRNGNTLSVTPGGITHSTGKGIVFQRDGAGRITAITDPAGEQLAYAYDAFGNLSSFTDQAGYVDRFTYDDSHILTELENPRGNASRNEYDEDGRLIRVIDPNGKAIELTHELAERREVVRDRRGFVRIFEYDHRGNVTKITDAQGKVTLRVYGNDDQLLSETDALGHTTTHEYDADLNLVAVVDPLGNTRSWTYDPFGNPLMAKDAKGSETIFTYDQFGNRTGVVDALGNTTVRAFDSNGNMTSQTDGRGNTTHYQYNVYGERVSTIDALGNMTSYEYDSNGNQLSETVVDPDSGGALASRSSFYDQRGRLTQVTDAEGAVTGNTYDGMGNVLAMTDALGESTGFAYDVLDRLTQVTDPDGLAMQQVFNEEGKVIRRTGRDGRTADIEYDPNNALVAVTLPGASTSSNVFDDLGRVVGTVDALGGSSSFELDAGGRVIRAVDASGGESVYARDANGNVVSMTGPGGQSVTIEYDALNRVIGVSAPDGTSVHTAYGPTGLVSSETDSLNRATAFDYDALGRLTAVTQPLDTVTAFLYDALGHLRERIDAAGRSNRMEYDRVGRLKKRILAGGQFETMEYDAAGKLVAQTDFRGRRTELAYGPYGPVTQRTPANDGPVTYGYGASGQRTSVTDARGTTGYLYDEAGRLSELTYPGGRRLSYAYDGVGRLTKMAAHVGPAVHETHYSYDASGRLDAMTDPAGGIYSYTYGESGALESMTYPNGVTTTYVHDDLRRLVSLETRTAQGEVIQSHAYSLDAGGRRTRVTEHDGVARSFAYDDLDRLTGETVTASGDAVYASTFTYDPVGNRLTRVHTDSGGATSTTSSSYDTRDRLLSAGEETLAWDANGNLVSRTVAGSSAAYVWDDEDRLRSAVMSDGVTVAHEYDADGNRVRTVVTRADGSEEVGEYLVDAASGPVPRVVAETDASGAVVSVYVYGPGIGPLAAIRPGGVRYLHADGLGSTRVLTDEDGVVTDRYAYTAFGELVEREGSDPNPYLFGGAALDVHTGLYDLHARWLDPGAGRFLSMDPVQGALTDPATQHPYLYAGGDPVNRLDPDGRFYLSLAVIFGLIQKPPRKGSVLEVRRDYFPLFVRVRPIIASGSNWPPSYVMHRVDEASDVWRVKAGIVPVYLANAPWHSSEIKPVLTLGKADQMMEKFFLPSKSGDGKSIPMLFISAFEDLKNFQGLGISPETERGAPGRGATIARVHRWDLGRDASDILAGDLLNTNWSDPVETCNLTATHELGHALGVKHPTKPVSAGLMNKGNCTSKRLTGAQIKTARGVAWMLR